MLAAIPTTTLTLPANALIGETLNFSVGFSNTSPSSAGFGPYVDLNLPATGGAGAGTPDGISFNSATYLSAALTSTVLTFDAGGHATHPYAKDNTGAAVIVSGTPGDQLVVLQLPFGSYTPGQPVSNISVSTTLSNLADVGSALNITTHGGFRYGNDALDNPTTDPTIIGGNTTSAVTPSLFIVTKQYIGPEDETATGPNFPRQDLITVDVAAGQTLTNLDITDLLPNNMQYVQVDATTIRGTATGTTSPSTPSTLTPGGTLTRRFASVTGTTAANDATLLYTYYIPLNNALGNPVLNASTGAPNTSTDNASAIANWTPINPTDAPVTGITSNTASHLLTDKSLATQKSVAIVTDTGAPGASPGDTLQYTINFQVSDFFAFQNLLLTDLISDGQHFDPTFTPTFQVNGNTYTLGTANFNASNFSVTGNYTGAIPAPATPDGTSTIAFNLSNEMVTRGQNGTLLGGQVSPGGGVLQSAPGDGPTTGTVTFRTVIQQKFTDNFPSGEANIDHGDKLTDAVTVQGDVLSIASLAPTGSTVTDNSAASVTIITGTLTKSIYAVNGSTSFTSPVKIAAGDTVTYRLQYTLPTSDEEQLALSDFLPLPIFTATSISAFDNVGYSGSANVIPATGHANFGPADTFRPLSSKVPTLTSDATANSLKFAYSNYKDPANSSTNIDLLFTVTVGNQPFADGLFLTNQAHAAEGTTNTVPTSQDAIVQLKLTEPVLNISKGVVTTDNSNAALSGTVGPVSFSAPGTAGYRGSATINSNGVATNPINAGITKIDAGDLVTFAIVVENTGTGLHGAFNVELKDALPAGFAIPAGGLNLSATDGTGAAISTIDLGGGLFGSGLELSDGGSTGALAPYNATNGQNILVLTFDLQATAAVTPQEDLSNTATLFHYASQGGGPDFLTSPLTATASVMTADVGVTKALTTTNQAFTSGSSFAIGEVATYTVVMTVPEGKTPAAQLIDTLPTGMALYSLDTLSASSGALSFSNGTLAAILAAANTGVSGASVTLDFGTITNSNRNNAVPETITLVYRAVALNVASNTQSATLTNTAGFDYTGGAVNASVTASVALPALQVVKTVDKPTAQAGDTVTYTMVLSHAGGSKSDAFDLTLSDVIPTDLTYVAGSLTNTAGLAPATLTQSAGTITATYGTFTKGTTSTITFQGVVGGGVAGLKPVTNTATVQFSTLPGTANGQISSYNTNSYERTGNASDPGGAVNDLQVQGSATFTPPLSVVKTILGTNQAFTTGNNVAIGERVQYQVTLGVSQGTTPGASLMDTLPSGLTILSLDSITASPSVSTSIGGGFAGVLSGAVVGAGGGSASFSFGTLTNTDTDSSTAETIVLTYTVDVLNVASNQNGTSLTNSATFTVPNGTKTASAAAVTVVTPVLRVVETPSSTTGDAGGAAITFTVVVSHTGASTANAYDIALADVVPSGFTAVSGSFTNTAGTAPSAISQSGNTLSATIAGLPIGSTSTYTFQAKLNGATTPGQVVTNTPGLTYTSLPGNVTTAQSPYNAVSTERTGQVGDPGGAVNSLTAVASASVTVNSNTVGGFVYADANNDGTKQGTEAGISGVTLNLAGTDNLGNVVSLTTTTTGTGAYTFNLLRPGTYTVSEVQPGAYLDGKDTLGTPFGGSSATNDVFSNLVIPTGVNAAGANYNYGELSPASVSVNVFSDGNNDGTKNGSDVGISGATVTLTGTNDLGQSINTPLTTDGSGNITFANLRPGTYSIAESQPAGYLDGTDNAGNTGGTLTNDHVTNFTLTAGQSDTGVTFAELAPASLGGVVYSDANNDGTKQAGESGIDGVFVTLTGTDDLGSAVNIVTVTSGGGVYAFTNLRPSNATGYTITETQPSAFLDGKDTIGTPGGVATVNDVFSGIVLNAGVNGTSNNFGELVPASLAGFVYEDVNNDGIKQAGDSGIGGVTVTLTGTDDLGASVNTTAVTVGSGAYSFTGLRPGTYALGETQPTVYVDGKDTAGTPGGSTVTKNSITAIALGAGIAGTSNNFAERPTSDLSLTKTVNIATPNVGTNVTFTVTLLNSGPDTATNVAVSDLLPAGLTFVSAAPSQGTYTSGSGLWTVGTVVNGGSKTLTVTATVVSPTAKTNTASISTVDQSDPTAVDNTASAAETPQLSDLGVAQAVSDPTPNVGDIITFTTVLTNNGPDTGTGIAISVPLPAGLTFVSAAPGQGGYNSATGNWTIGTVASTGSVTLVVTAKVVSPNPRTDTATISAADQYDTVAANNTASATETPKLADLVVTKVVSDPTPNVGDVITFTVTLTNNGPNTTTNVSLHDLVPAGLTFLSAAPTLGAYNSSSGLWTLGTVASGASPSIIFTVFVVSPNVQINTASVITSDVYDPNSANNTASASETPQQADLSLSKTTSNATPNVGDVITFTVTLTNNGPSHGTNVTVNDLLPSGLSYVSSNPSQGSYDSASGHWTVGTIASGASTTLTMQATVVATTNRNNTASVGHSDQYDPNLANDSATANETPQQAELALAETISNATPNLGDVIAFTLTLTNNGPDTATNVTVNDALPAGLTFVSAAPLQGSYASGTNVWTVGSLGSGGSTTLVVNARVVSPNTQFNPVTITHADQYDPILPNNSATVSETPKQADLAVSKTVNSATPNVGDNITFTITLANNGPDTATNVVVSDALPDGLAFSSYVSSQGTYDSGTGLWTIGSVASGASKTLSIVALVVSPNPRTNSAAVSASDVYDPNIADNSANVTETPQLADLAVTKSVDNATPNVGDTITFTVTLTNSGPDSGTHVAVSDPLPAGLTYLSSSPSQGTYDSASGLWTVGSVATSATLIISARVVSPNPLTNTAVVSHSDQFDPIAANNAGNVIETPQRADLALTKSVDNAAPRLGTNVTFTINLQNVGPDAATHVAVADLLPPGLSYVSALPTQGNYDSSTGIWTVGTVPNHGNATLSVVALVIGQGVKTNTAQVGASDQYDPNSTPGNSNPSEDDQASVEVTPLSSLAGSVFLDANNDGIRGTGETGIAGVTVTLTGTNNLEQPVSLTLTTGADGGYLFDNLRPGTYTVTETQPPAYNDGLDAFGTAGGTLGNDVVSAIALGAGVVSNGYTFGEIGATLSGTVFVDADKDAILNNNESGLFGVTVTLEDGTGNVLATAVSGSDGTYHFSNLPAGPYQLVSTPPVGYAQSTPVTLHPTLPLAGLTGQNFGETTASLAGHVYVDANNDGAFQGSESGLAGTTVTLNGTNALNATVNQTATTLADGSYTFPGLLSGTYAVALTPPVNYLDGLRTIGTPGGTTGAEQFTNIMLGGGVSGTNNNFGELVPSSIAGVVYHDANDDGIKGSGELPASGVALSLTGTDDLNHPVTATTTTAVDGSYSFGNLRPGTYAVAVTRPPGEFGGKNAIGSQGGTVGGDALSALVLTSGTTGVNNQFALIDPASLGGSVYFDSNNDGIRQTGEAGLAGVTVSLNGTDDNGLPIQTVATTAADGSYLFGSLRPGLYSVTETQPSGYGQGKNAVGSAGGTLSNDLITGITLVASVQATGYLFGEQGSTLSGIVTIDNKPVSDALITVRDSSGHVIATGKTGSDGSYTLPNLPAGSFTLVFDQSNPDGTHTTTQRLITLSPGAAQVQSLKVNTATAGISGSVFLDDQKNGIRDPNEYGIAHVVVTLNGVDDLGNVVTRTTTSDQNGGYSFTDLRAGTYTVSAIGPKTFIDGAGHAGTAGGTASTDKVSSIVLQPGQIGTDYTLAKIARPDCRLKCVEYHAVLLQKAFPTGVPASFAHKHTSYKPIPVIQYWVPTLAAWFGYGPGGIPGPRAAHYPHPTAASFSIAHKKG